MLCGAEITYLMKFLQLAQIKNLQKFFAKRFNQEAKPGSSPPMMPRVADNDVELFLVGPAGIEQVQETTTVEEMTKV